MSARDGTLVICHDPLKKTHTHNTATIFCVCVCSGFLEPTMVLFTIFFTHSYALYIRERETKQQQQQWKTHPKRINKLGTNWNVKMKGKKTKTIVSRDSYLAF